MRLLASVGGDRMQVARTRRTPRIAVPADTLGKLAERANHGLSDGQLRLARETVGGLSLPVAAAKLGIDPNTARTHLNRIFD